MTLLIADDMGEIREYYHARFRALFPTLQIIEADSLRQAKEGILKADPPPDAVLSDFNMGDGTASKLLSWLETEPVDLFIPVIVMSALPRQATIGCQDFLACVGVYDKADREAIVTAVAELLQPPKI